MGLSRTSQIAIFFVILAGCHHRAPVLPEDAGPQDSGLELLQLPDLSLSDIGVPELCRKDHAPWILHTDPRGNFVLAVPEAVSVFPVAIDGAAGTDSAAGLNHPEVAALVVTRTAKLPHPSAEVDDIQQTFFAAVSALGSATVRASGSTGTSAEGHPEVKEVIWDISIKGSVEPGYLRDRLMAAALLRPLSSLNGLPGPVGEAVYELVIKMAVVRRPQGLVVVSAAVAGRDAYENLASPLAFLVDDLSNGTAVAAPGKTPEMECDIRSISSKPVADIIWIVDESGSMNDNRQDIVNNATTFFAKALAAGLDFRMGVAGMKKPIQGVQLGKLCSYGAGASTDAGGEDRFLLPSEQEVFTDCVKNPPYYEGGSEHGLTHGYWAVKSHLPRADASPHRIRKDAHLAVIYATDETAQELKEGSTNFFGQEGFLNYLDYKKTSCQLTPDKQTKLETFIAPVVDLYSEAKASVHVIGGVCNNPCNAEIAHGYRELVGAFGGQLGDVCQHDLNATLQVIIDSINASASPRTLKYVPISSTLAVEANGLRLERSRTQGWIYNPTSNSLTFINVQVPKGAVVVASYRRFR